MTPLDAREFNDRVGSVTISNENAPPANPTQFVDPPPRCDACVAVLGGTLTRCCKKRGHSGPHESRIVTDQVDLVVNWKEKP